MKKLLIPIVMILLGVASIATAWGAPTKLGELPCAADVSDESGLVNDDGCIISDSALREWQDEPSLRWDRIIGSLLILAAIPTFIVLFILSRRSAKKERQQQIPPPA